MNKQKTIKNHTYPRKNKCFQNSNSKNGPYKIVTYFRFENYTFRLAKVQNFQKKKYYGIQHQKLATLSNFELPTKCVGGDICENV